ncbi:MAG: MBL fold metallo-hydrolase [Microthrixaceae bacterium]
MLNVSFYGVRGSTPCACDTNRRYGGNTSCVVVESPGEDPILLDLGTGLRFYGLTFPCDQPFRGTALVSLLHWDHVQGIPFFAPMLRDGAHMNVFGPRQEQGSLREAVKSFIQPPYFPVSIEELPGEFRFTEVEDEVLHIGSATVTVASVPHRGPTVGYRIESQGVAIVYISDHQQPSAGSNEVTPEVLALCADADLLIHDAQFDAEEFLQRSDWGHCTVEYAVEVAQQAGVKRLALFHHDPSHDDDRVDELLLFAQQLKAAAGLQEVLAASEGLTLSFEPASLQ